MPKVEVNVELLEYTKDPLSLIWAACRQCYSAEFAGDMFTSLKVVVTKFKSRTAVKIMRLVIRFPWSFVML